MTRTPSGSTPPADGDALRIEVLSATDVVVHNSRSRHLTAWWGARSTGSSSRFLVGLRT